MSMNSISILLCSHKSIHPYIDIKFFMRVIVGMVLLLGTWRLHFRYLCMGVCVLYCTMWSPGVRKIFEIRVGNVLCVQWGWRRHTSSGRLFAFTNMPTQQFRSNIHYTTSSPLVVSWCVLQIFHFFYRNIP